MDGTSLPGMALVQAQHQTRYISNFEDEDKLIKTALIWLNVHPTHNLCLPRIPRHFETQDFFRDCPIYHTKSRINCITFILEILFQYRWVPRTRPRERCTRLFVACLIIIVQEHTWILVKTRNNWSSMSTLISNVRFRAKFSTIFRLWNAYSAIFQRFCSRSPFWCAVLKTKSFESKGMVNSRFWSRIIENWQSIIFQAGFYIQSDVLRVWFSKCSNSHFPPSIVRVTPKSKSKNVEFTWSLSVRFRLIWIPIQEWDFQFSVTVMLVT